MSTCTMRGSKEQMITYKQNKTMTLQQKIHHSNQIANAIHRHEEYYKVKPLVHIDLPTPQVCGTMTQRRSYAVGKAMELIENYAKS